MIKPEEYGSLTIAERESLFVYLKALSQMILTRHRNAKPEEVEAAMYDLQDYLNNVTINDTNNGLDV
jgi:hypothetical protein